MRRPLALAAAAALAGLAPRPVLAGEGPLQLAGEITVDMASVRRGGTDRTVRALTNLSLAADADLAALAGWDGGQAHVEVLDNRGRRPNDALGTLQGINNIEVPDAGLRLFEAWVEQDLGKGASLRLGLYDLNSEFYANDAAGLLVAPPFGIGSELAATGPNGPSIFPSSSLAARLSLPVGEKGFARFAVVNARAGTLGDRQGLDFSFRDGLLLVGEAGIGTGPLRGVVGVWRYTRRPASIFTTRSDGTPERRVSQGAYLVIEGDLLPAGPRQLTAFVRAGVSDSHTTPFTGGFQTGMLLAPALSGREDSAFSLGVHHAWTNRFFRAAQAAGGQRPARGESAVEVTYSDTLGGGLSVQPDLQWVLDPGGDADARDAVVATLRLTYSF